MEHRNIEAIVAHLFLSMVNRCNTEKKCKKYLRVNKKDDGLITFEIYPTMDFYKDLAASLYPDGKDCALAIMVFNQLFYSSYVKYPVFSTYSSILFHHPYSKKGELWAIDINRISFGGFCATAKDMNIDFWNQKIKDQIKEFFSHLLNIAEK